MNKTDKKNYAIRKEYSLMLLQLPAEHRRPFNKLFKTKYQEALLATTKSGTYEKALWLRVFNSILEDYATHFFNLPKYEPDTHIDSKEDVSYETTQYKAVRIL